MAVPLQKQMRHCKQIIGVITLEYNKNDKLYYSFRQSTVIVDSAIVVDVGIVMCCMTVVSQQRQNDKADNNCWQSQSQIITVGK